MPGNISDLAGTNDLNTQLERGQMEMTTIADVVKDSGAIDITVGEGEQDDDYPPEVQGGNCDDSHLQTGETKTLIVAGVAKESGEIDVILEDGEKHGNKPVEMQSDNCNEDPYINKKSHQGTQTELSTIASIADVVLQEPMKATHL